MGLHARGLHGEDDGAIGRGRVEEGPCHRGGVADDCRAFDEILEGLCRLERLQLRKAIGRDQVDVGKLRN